MSSWSYKALPTLAIAYNTYREAVRSKVLYAILFFALFLFVFSALLGEASLNQNLRVILDLGLFALSLFGNLVAVFLGVSFVHKEIERKSLYNILSKPIRRWHYVVGKFGGILATIVLQLAVMSAVLALVVLAWSETFPKALLAAFWLVAIEVMVVASIALFFSSFSTPYLSGFFTLGVFVVGKSVQTLSRFAESMENVALANLIDVLERVVPALHIFNVSTQVTYGLRIPFDFVLHATAYGLGYTLIVLLLACLIFSRRDFV